MFNKLINFLTSEGSSRPNKGLIADQLEKDFFHDYIDTKELLKSTPAHLAEEIEEWVSCTRDYLSDRSSESSKTHRILISIQELYLKLWIHESGYFEPLVNKAAELIYVDAYGDTQIEDWRKEVRNFVDERRVKIDYYFRESIPPKYHSYASKLGKESYLSLSNNSPEDAEDFIETIIDILNIEIVVFLDEQEAVG